MVLRITANDVGVKTYQGSSPCASATSKHSSIVD